jgi:hypothetical protein
MLADQQVTKRAPARHGCPASRRPGFPASSLSRFQLSRLCLWGEMEPPYLPPFYKERNEKRRMWNDISPCHSDQLDNFLQLAPQYSGLFNVGIDTKNSVEITSCLLKVAAAE